MHQTRSLLAPLRAVAVLAVSAGLLGCSASGAATNVATSTAQALATAPAQPSSSPSRALAPSPSSASAPTPSATRPLAASPVPTLIPVPPGDSTPGSPLEAGARYVTPNPFPIRVSFVAPPDWAGNTGGPNAVWTGPAATGNDLSFQMNLEVPKDPCHPEKGMVALSATPTVDALVNALTDRRGLADTTPKSTTLGGLPATSFRLRLEGPTGSCTNDTHLIWKLPLGATNELQSGTIERVSVVEVAGQPLVVTAVDAGDATVNHRIQQLLDSVRFEASN